MKKIIIRTIKSYSFYIILFLGLLVGGLVEAKAAPVAKNDHRLIKSYVRSSYGHGYKLRIAPAEKTPDKVISSRAGKRIVYVDQFQTVSRGRYGVVSTDGPFKGRRIKYLGRHRRGQKITVYWVYNPLTSYTDDIVATIESGHIGH